LPASRVGCAGGGAQQRKNKAGFAPAGWMPPFGAARFVKRSGGVRPPQRNL